MTVERGPTDRAGIYRKDIRKGAAEAIPDARSDRPYGRKGSERIFGQAYSAMIFGPVIALAPQQLRDPFFPEGPWRPRH